MGRRRNVLARLSIIGSRLEDKTLRYLFAINHPSQFHVFKNLALNLMGKGHSCIFFIQQRGFVELLAKQYGIDYRFLVSPIWKKKLTSKTGILLRGLIHLIQADIRVIIYCLLNKVDFLLGSDISITHAGFILRKHSLAFTDDDVHFIKPYSRLAFPFATNIVAPSVVNLEKWSFKKIAYPGTQKTAYVHPRMFKPNPDVLRKYSLMNSAFVIVRRVEFKALHDSMHIAQTGITDSVLDKIISGLVGSHKIIMSNEGEQNPKYKKYGMKIEPSDMLDLIYYADLLIGDSQSMQVEAALLGTPSIRSNKWVLEGDKVSVIHHLENKYDLCIGIPPKEEETIVSTALRLLQSGVKDEWRKKIVRFYEENISLTDMLMWLLDDYNTRAHMIKQDPSVLLDFLYPMEYSEDS